MKRIGFWLRSVLAATALMTVPVAANAQENGARELSLVPESDEPDLRRVDPRFQVMIDLDRFLNRVYDPQVVVVPDPANEIYWSASTFFNSPTGSYVPLVTGFRF